MFSFQSAFDYKGKNFLANLDFLLANFFKT